MKKEEQKAYEPAYGVWVENKQKVYLYDLKLNESVVHPVWGRGLVISLKERKRVDCKI